MKYSFKRAAVLLCVAGGLAGGQRSLADEGLFAVRNQGIVHDALYDICFNETTGFAVGVAGALVESRDQGASWQVPPALGTEAILGLDCASSNILAVGQGGLIQRLEGSTWQKVESGVQARMLDVSANDAGLAIAVGGFGTVLRSRDGGKNWEPLTFDWEALLNDFVEPHIYDAKVSPEGVATIVGEFGLVLQSTDGGYTWNMTHHGDESLFALELDGNVGYVVGQNGAILRTEDGALTWRRLDSGTQANLLDVLTDRNGVVHVTGIRTLLQSADGGNTWVARQPGDVSSRWYQSLASSQAGVFMVGHSGRIVQITE